MQVSTLNYFNGAPLIYTRVREKEVNGLLTERQYDPMSSIGGNSGKYPYVALQDLPNLSGLLLKTIVRDNTGTTKSEQKLTYNKIIDQLNDSLNRNIKTGMIASAIDYPIKYYVADLSFVYVSRAELISDTTAIYEGGNSLDTTENKTYDATKYYLRSSTTKNSLNEAHITELKYPFDYSGGAYTDMINRNIITPVVETIRSKVGSPNVEQYRSKTNYALFQSSTLPMPSASQNSIFGNSLVTVLTFDNYDEKGNLVQYTGKDGVVTSIIWGYNKTYPVAKVVGASYSTAIALLNTTVLNYPSSDAALRTELNNLRTGLSGSVLVTTLTHKPLIGVTSETDPKGLTVYYEYGSFNRLKVIRDKDNNILKKFEYNYVKQTNNQ
jgi:hypothetical protein